MFHNHRIEKIKYTKVHHFHEFLPKLQRSVKLIKLEALLALILLFQFNYSIQLHFIVGIISKIVLDLTACVSHR